MSREEVGNRIRELRKNQNLSQKELARLSGVSRYYVSQVELGKQSPTVDVIDDMATALHVSLEELFRGL